MNADELKREILKLPLNQWNNEIVVVMPDDPTAIYAVQGLRFNNQQKTVEVLVA